MFAACFQSVLTLAQQTPPPGTQPASTGLSNMLIVWGIVLIGAALALFFVEVLVPSGGLLGIAAAACAVIGVVLLFQVNTTVGLISAIICVALLPILIGLALRMWPETPLGRLLAFRPTIDPENPSGEPAGPSEAAKLLGHSGEAVTDLRPIGTCLIDGERRDCLAVGGQIDAGSQIEVVAADAMQVKVRKKR